MQNIRNLYRTDTLYNAVSYLPQSFSFNGTNGYIQQVGYSGGVVRKQNDGSRDYWQCYGGYFNIGDSAVHGLDNRSVQTQKFVFQIDDMLNVVALSSYNTNGAIMVETDGRIRIELGGTASLRIFSVTTVTPGQIYNVIVKYNNTLPSGTQRVVGDATMFINGVKETSPTTQGIGNATSTTTMLYRGSYNAALSNFRGRLYNFSLWNRALSDAECQAEGLSNRSVVTPSGLVNTWDTTDTSQAISRTGYNLTGGGNYSVATDGDGKYVLINGNKDQTAGTGTASGFSGGSFSFTQTSTFSFAFKVKINNLPPNNYSGIFGSGNNFSAGLQQSGGNFIRIISKPTYSSVLVPITLGVACTIHVCYEPTTGKAYVYKDGVIQNSGGTAMSPTFTAGSWILGDMGGETNTLVSSSSKNIYFARVRQRTLTQSDVAADISLGNTEPNDPTIVASYRPDNLINWQGVASPSDYTSWAKTGSTTTTSNTTVAPDGTTTADTVTISGTATQGIEKFTTDLTGSSLASKTFIVKAFVKVASGTAQFRLKNTHRLVADYFSVNLTATTTRQEFTFTQTFTSATNGTGVTYGIINDTGATNPTLQVRNVRVFLVNEILYDNSPNIGGYVGPLSNRYYSSWVRLGADGVDTAFSQPILTGTYGFTHIRTSNNIAYGRVDHRAGSSGVTYTLGSGNRNRNQLILGLEYEPTTQSFRGVVWIGGLYIGQTAFFKDASQTLTQLMVFAGRYSTGYLNGSLRDMRIFTSPTALTDAQALMITNGGDPMDVTKVLHRDALPSDTTNYVTDKSGNGRVGYITGGVTKTYG